MTTTAKMTTPNVRCVSNNTLDTQFIVNGSFSCDAVYEDFLTKQLLVFDKHHLVRVLVIWGLFLFSCFGNILVLYGVTLRRSSGSVAHTQLLMKHLALANLAFTFFVLPMDAIWNCTMEWLGGDVLCRISNMLKQFSMYISSAVIVVMVVDRVVNLHWHLPINQRRNQAQIMLAVAWGFSFANSIPACVIFSTIAHWPGCECPEHFIRQCVDFKLVSDTGLKIFNIYSLCISFFIPLICVIICYFLIVLAIAKMAKQAKETESRSSGFRPPSGRKSLARQHLDRAKRRSQLMTGLITACFIVCWCPYYIIGVIYWFNGKEPTEPPEVVNRVAEEIMLLSMYLNPCLHPLIMVLILKDVKKNLCRKITCFLPHRRAKRVEIATKNQEHLVKPEGMKVDDTNHVTLFKEVHREEML